MKESRQKNFIEKRNLYEHSARWSSGYGYFQWCMQSSTRCQRQKLTTRGPDWQCSTTVLVKFLQHLEHGIWNNRLGPWWFFNENFKLLFKGKWHKQKNESDDSFGKTLSGMWKLGLLQLREGSRKAGSCGGNQQWPFLEKEQSLTTELRRDGSSEMESLGGTPHRKTAGSQEKGWETRLALWERETVGRGWSPVARERK